MSDYIPIAADALVIIVAVSLYLIDVARLLYADEILLVHGSRSEWSPIYSADGIRFARRRLVFPRFYDPGSVSIRCHWSTRRVDIKSRRIEATTAIEGKLGSLLVPRVICNLLLPEIFVGVPAAYYLADNIWPVFFLVLAIYAQVIALVIWLFISRSKLQLRWTTSILIAFESLICIPYAINFHRKVAEQTLNLSGTNILATGEALLAVDRLRVLRRIIRDALDDRIDRKQDTTRMLERLRVLRSELEQE